MVLCPPCQRRLSTNNAHIACATTYNPRANTEHSTRNTVHGETRRHHAPSREGGAGERGGRGRFGSGWLPWARSRPLLDRPHMWGDPLGSPRGQRRALPLRRWGRPSVSTEGLGRCQVGERRAAPTIRPGTPQATGHPVHVHRVRGSGGGSGLRLRSLGPCRPGHRRPLRTHRLGGGGERHRR